MANLSLLNELIKEQRDIIHKLTKFDELNSQLETINATISKLFPDYQQNTPLESDHPYFLNGYDINGIWKDKVAYAIEAQARFVHVKEIGEFLHSVEKGVSPVEYYIEKAKVQTGLLKNEGKIIRHQEGNNVANSFWGKPEWKKGDVILRGYEFDPKYLILKKVTLTRIV